MAERRKLPSADFRVWSHLLREQGLGWPKFVIERSRLQANIERIGSVATGDHLRLVVKSLPCPSLIDYLMAATGSYKLMVFHLPFLLQVTERWPEADIMLGKPLPSAAVRAYFHATRGQGRKRRSGALHWLVDTPRRVADYRQIARDFNESMDVIVELDVGMHRGGAQDAPGLKAMLEAIAASDGTLRLTGFMGYDAHAGKGVPWLSRRRAVDRSNRHYRKLLDVAHASFPELVSGDLIINGSGSPTCVFHAAGSPLNELAIGSIFLKPAEFDLPQLIDFEPACWLAAPVIKRLKGVRIPFLESFSRWSRRDTVFIYGGRWPARPAWPPGLRDSPIYGPSFNQQFYTLPRSGPVRVDDFVFFRPLQSEAVMLALGDVLVLDGNEIEQFWRVFSQDVPAGILKEEAS